MNDTANWWYCDNLVDHPDYIGLLHLGFPRCFILFRNSMEYNTASFDDWKTGVAEVNFLDPEDRQTTDIEELLVGAWNFCALQEAKEEELYNDGYDE